jgi:hypothetical protein
MKFGSDAGERLLKNTNAANQSKVFRHILSFESDTEERLLKNTNEANQGKVSHTYRVQDCALSLIYLYSMLVILRRLNCTQLETF